MPLRRTATGAVIVPPTPSPLADDRSTWANQPRLLASNDAESAAIECGTYAVGIVLALALLAGIAWSEWGADPVDVLIFVAVSIVIGALVTLWRWSTTYAEALRADTDEARRATWQREIDTGEDIDGDNFIGDPFASLTVHRQGKEDEAVIYDLPRDSDKAAPIMKGWGVSKADLVSFLFEAEHGRGLNERAWVEDKRNRHILPSGRDVTQPIFRSVLASLAEHGMAVKQSGKWVLDVKAEDVARSLKS
jgi:hypothetical protein